MSPTSSGSMGATVPVREHWRNNPRRDAVVTAYRIARGITKDETARQHLLRLPEMTVAAIIAHRAHATPARYQSFTAPIATVLNHPTVARLTPELEVQAAQLDGSEDLREKAYDLHPCRETALARVRAIDADMALAAQVRAGLVAKHGLDL